MRKDDTAQRTESAFFLMMGVKEEIKTGVGLPKRAVKLHIIDNRPIDPVASNQPNAEHSSYTRSQAFITNDLRVTN